MWVDNRAEPFLFSSFFVSFRNHFSPVHYTGDRYDLHSLFTTRLRSPCLSIPPIIDIVTYSYDHNSFLQ